jgi:hypothetical protein
MVSKRGFPFIKMMKLSHFPSMKLLLSHIFLIYRIDETIKQLILELTFHQTLKSTSTSTTTASMTSSRH